MQLSSYILQFASQKDDLTRLESNLKTGKYFTNQLYNEYWEKDGCQFLVITRYQIHVLLLYKKRQCGRRTAVVQGTQPKLGLGAGDFNLISDCNLSEGPLISRIIE